MSQSMYEVGQTRESVGRTVSRSDLATWGGLVHDYTRLHFDEAHVATTQFKRPIAHGYIALNWSIGLMFPEHAGWYAPDGADRVKRWEDVRFVAPVFVGDTLTSRRTVESVIATEVQFRVQVINQNGIEVLTGTEVVGYSQPEATK